MLQTEEQDPPHHVVEVHEVSAEDLSETMDTEELKNKNKGQYLRVIWVLFYRSVFFVVQASCVAGLCAFSIFLIVLMLLQPHQKPDYEFCQNVQLILCGSVGTAVLFWWQSHSGFPLPRSREKIKKFKEWFRGIVFWSFSEEDFPIDVVIIVCSYLLAMFVLGDLGTFRSIWQAFARDELVSEVLFYCFSGLVTPFVEEVMLAVLLFRRTKSNRRVAVVVSLVYTLAHLGPNFHMRFSFIFGFASFFGRLFYNLRFLRTQNGTEGIILRYISWILDLLTQFKCVGFDFEMALFPAILFYFIAAIKEVWMSFTLRGNEKSNGPFGLSYSQVVRGSKGCDLGKPKYVVEQRGKAIGRGAYGTVFEGVMIERRAIALKVIVLISPEEDRDRVEHEVQLHQKLQHENVVHCYGVEYVRDEAWIMMELCACDLKEWRSAMGDTMVLEVFERCLLQIARGMAYIHSTEDGTRDPIIHYDLTPENILMTTKTADAVLKITDCGVAKNLQSALTKECRGKPLFMPASNKGDKTKIDVYAFGILIWWLWYGKLPFENLRKAYGGIELKEAIHADGASLVWGDPMPPERIQELSINCTEREDTARPHFSEIVQLLQ